MIEYMTNEIVCGEPK